MAPTTRQRLTLTAAAEYLDVSERTLRRYIAEGRLPAYRLGKRQIRIEVADLDKLVQPIPTTGEAS